MSDKFLLRARKFTPQNIFLSVLNLATSTNNNGLHASLQKSWQDLKLSPEETPTKSSLSEARGKVSYTFFKDIYDSDLERLNTSRKTFRGFHIYAVDGDDLNLPCSRQILKEGYRGYLYDKKHETYYPKMYTVYAYDVINGLVQRFAHSKTREELYTAIGLIPSFEKNSIAIYDRLYGGYPVMSEHEKAGSYFLIRLKKKATVVRDFIQSGDLDLEVEWVNSQNKEDTPLKVRLIKAHHPKTKELMVFATNLSKTMFSRKDLLKLYQKRWQIETSFRDLTHTLQIEQWHSKSANGILQEIYALLWFVNNIKIQMSNRKGGGDFLDQSEYYKSNFKLCIKIVMDNIFMVIRGHYQKLRRLLKFWLERTVEKRRWRSRSYPRILKGRLTKYPVHSKIRRRKKP